MDDTSRTMVVGELTAKSPIALQPHKLPKTTIAMPVRRVKVFM
jgi:hypothetical protein